MATLLPGRAARGTISPCGLGSCVSPRQQPGQGERSPTCAGNKAKCPSLPASRHASSSPLSPLCEQRSECGAVIERCYFVICDGFSHLFNVGWPRRLFALLPYLFDCAFRSCKQGHNNSLPSARSLALHYSYISFPFHTLMSVLIQAKFMLNDSRSLSLSVSFSFSLSLK